MSVNISEDYMHSASVKDDTSTSEESTSNPASTSTLYSKKVPCNAVPFLILFLIVSVAAGAGIGLFLGINVGKVQEAEPDILPNNQNIGTCREAKEVLLQEKVGSITSKLEGKSKSGLHIGRAAPS